MVLVTRSGSNNEEILKIIQDANKSTDEKISELTKKFDDYLENTKQFRVKLEATISKIRESHGDIADQLDQLIHDWNEL